MVTLRREDIQGMVVSSYKHLHCAAYLLLQIKNPNGVRDWLSRHIGEITNSKTKHPDFSTNIALTSTGLINLGLSQDALSTFSLAFQDGMATDHRSRILGDSDENQTSHWEWGTGEENKRVDILLLIFAKDDIKLSQQLAQRRAELSVRGACTEIKVLEAGRQPDSREHFGFNDGIGQPVMEGTGNKERQLKRTHHATELPAGEFLMGYQNLYGVSADSPAVSAATDPNNLLPIVPEDTTALNAKPGMHDLGCNGTYLVFRQLAQNVAKFWNFLDQSTQNQNNTSNPCERNRLAAKFVGRWPSGAPLVLSPQTDDPSLGEENNFGYRDKDPTGTRCPIGSHIRRANPRDSFGDNAKEGLASANRHRILRRGRSYGHRIEDQMKDDGVERGLHFICLNSDIERQFEFVQQTWINSPVFGALDGEVDPLIGNLPKGDSVFTVQGEPLRKRILGLTRFVTVKGGAYFFLPSIAALKYLAGL